MIYASHYFWTALDLRVLVPDPARGRGFWFVNVSRSRLDGLSGFVGQRIRSRVQSDVQKALATSLKGHEGQAGTGRECSVPNDLIAHPALAASYAHSHGSSAAPAPVDAALLHAGRSADDRQRKLRDDGHPAGASTTWRLETTGYSGSRSSCIYRARLRCSGWLRRAAESHATVAARVRSRLAGRRDFVRRRASRPRL